MKILITGAGGQLGASFESAWRSQHHLIPLDRTQLDITHRPDVTSCVRRARPDVLINCAAYNKVDAAEHDPGSADLVNAEAVRHLAEAAGLVGAVLVHYSTDFVFDGEATQPYHEDSVANPKSEYGRSKLRGEGFALRHPNTYVLRVASLFGGAGAVSSIDRIADALAAGRESRVFCDRTATPSFCADVIDATGALLAGGAPRGLYHCVNSGAYTWHELALEMARLLNCDSTAHIRPVLSTEAALAAARPRFAALSNAKLTKLFAMPPLIDALQRHLHARKLLTGH